MIYSRQKTLKLIEQKKNLNTPDSEDKTPLYYAIHDRDHNLLNQLIKHGADVQALNNLLETPLHLSVFPEIVKLLVLHGACLDQVNQEGYTPLYKFVNEYGMHLITISCMLKMGLM